jgi:hypothetical protein
MYTTTTLFLTLSALVANRALAAPSHPPSDTDTVVEVPDAVSFAGAPMNGSYPDQVADMGGFNGDAPTYDTLVSPHMSINPLRGGSSYM